MPAEWIAFAEGIERSDQLDVLTDVGVPLFQGYPLGRPAATAPVPVDLTVARATRRARTPADLGRAGSS